MKLAIISGFVLFLIPLTLFAQQPAATPRQPAQQASAGAVMPMDSKAAPLLSPAICGKGVFQYLLGTQSLGSETFEITCRADKSYAASGHTEMKLPGLVVDLNTSIETDREATPSKFTLKGTLGANAIDQTVAVTNDRATIVDSGKTQEVPYVKGATFMVPNVTYLFQFVAAHYDTGRNGVQQLSIFPNLQITMERTGHFGVLTQVSATAPSQPKDFDRYSLRMAGVPELVMLTDRQGRLAAFTVPAQNFMAVREDYAGLVESLRAVVAYASKDLVPDYSAPPNALFTAEEVAIERTGYKLAGTLLLPKTSKAPYPAVVMSTGSGQQTRDESMTLPGLEKYRPFRQIAERLASRGIAVLRVDDRGVGSSTGLDTLEKTTTFDYADDVRSQVAYLRTRREIDPARIAVIGHSEGGIIAPLVAASDSRLAAIVLLAGPAGRGDEVLRYQLDLLFASDPKMTEEERARKRAENRAFIRAIIEKGDVSKYPAALQGLNSEWGRAFLTYDPLPTIRKVRQPILILQGALDRQVTAEQAATLEQAARAAGNKDVTARVFPSLNHLFLPAKTGEENEYTKLDTYAIPDEVLDVLSDWLEQKLKVTR